MKLLIDTHVWLWSLTQPSRLNRGARQTLGKQATACYVSAISVWEVGSLVRRNRYKINGTYSQWLATSIERFPVSQVPIDFEIAAQATQLRLPQSDFADLIIAATSLCLDIPILTADSQLLAQPWLKTIDAT